MRWVARARLLALALLLSAAVAAPAAPRVVAIGDVHGTIEGLDAILREAALIDAAGAWVGGDAVLVQTGDFTDRGTRVRAVMDRLRALQPQASAAGGAVHVLLGNHEVMNLLLLFRDVNPGTYAEFAGPDSEERRQAALERRRARAAERAATEGTPAEAAPGDGFDEAAWLAAHPPGALEYAEAFGPDGEYGRWLRGLPASVRLEDSVFVHGGYSDEVEFGSPDEFNRALAEEIERFDDARRHLIDEDVILPSFAYPEIEVALAEEIREFAARLKTGETVRAPWAQETHRKQLLAMAESGRGWALREDSPLWFRGFARWSAEEGAPRVETLLDRFGARRFVVGHTVVSPPGMIRQRFGGGVYLIDTGMLASVYGGRPSALEIAGGLVRAVYPGGQRQVLWADVPPAAVALSLLRDGEVVSEEEVPRGVTRPLLLELASGDRRVRAILRYGVDERQGVRLRDGRRLPYLRDHWRNEVAAYGLARALGLAYVPPTVERRVGGREGSLQLWIEGALAAGGPEHSAASTPGRARALADMVVFDNLIQNIDRHGENVLEGPDGRIWWIDHTRSFSRDPRLPAPERIATVSRPLWERLRAISDDEIRAAVEGSLGRFEVRALLERRQRLVEHVESLIRERGEESVVVPVPGDEADAA